MASPCAGKNADPPFRSYLTLRTPDGRMVMAALGLVLLIVAVVACWLLPWRLGDHRSPEAVMRAFRTCCVSDDVSRMERLFVSGAYAESVHPASRQWILRFPISDVAYRPGEARADGARLFCINVSLGNLGVVRNRMLVVRVDGRWYVKGFNSGVDESAEAFTPDRFLPEK